MIMLNFSEEEHEEDAEQLKLEQELTSYAQGNDSNRGKLGDTIQNRLDESNPVVKKNSFFDQFGEIVSVSINEQINKSKFIIAGI